MGGQINGAFDKARDDAGLDQDVTPHTLRHTFATWHYAANRDLILLMERGGWKRAEMAIGYTKLAPAVLPARLFAHGWDFRGSRETQHNTPDYFGRKIRVLRSTI